MKNLHISLNEFRNASRILKETQSLVDREVFSKIYIASLWGEGLEESESIPNGIQLNRFKLNTRSYGKNIFIQILKYIEFCCRIFNFYSKKDVKVINIHRVSLLPLGILLKYSYRAKLVYDAHELETESNGLKGARKKLAKLIEKTLIGKVDLIIVVSDPIADWYRETYKIDRPTVILNTPKVTKKLVPNNYFRKKFNICLNKKIFLYQGSLARGRGIELLLECFGARKNQDVVIIFMGFGLLKKTITDKQKICDNIFFHPAVSPQELPLYTSSADIGLSIIENTCLSYYYCLPNKLFEYAMAGLPVLASNMQEMKNFIHKYKMGIVIKENKVNFLNKAIDEILETHTNVLSDNARRAAIENSWEIQEAKMILAYSKVLNVDLG